VRVVPPMAPSLSAGIWNDEADVDAAIRAVSRL
jgi:hypothetical protein